MAEQPAYRNRLSLERGGLPRPVYGARSRAHREQHGLVVAATEDVSTLVEPALRHWAYDLRRGRLTIYGGLLRFIDLLHRRGFSKETALKIPAWITAYIEDTWSDEPAAHVVEPLELVRRKRAA